MRASKNIILVDDDATICHALSVFLETSGYKVRTFSSAEAFLREAEDVQYAIMLLDHRMTGMSGLDLQAKLAEHNIYLPIIFITGHGDVETSVKAMKAGAIDFIEKPFSNADLLASIREAFLRADDCKKIAEFRRLHESLSDREQEVMRHIIVGTSNKDIAELLGISRRTIEVHRSKVMKKMKAESLVDLVRICGMCQQANQ